MVRTASSSPVCPVVTSGSFPWTPNSAAAIGQYSIVAQFSDGTQQCTGQYITLVPTVNNVYSTPSVGIDPGSNDADSAGQIHYTISADVNSCTVQVGGDTLNGATGGGTDQYVNWNGSSDSAGDYDGSGVYPVTITTDPAAGPNLQLSVTSDNLSYTTGNTTPLTISFTIAEPVERPQATQAFVTAVIYDSEGDPVRTLADGTQAFTIDNGTGTDSGGNSITWDGNDGTGTPVYPDTYTLALFAKDNAGVGCESPLTTVSVQVLDGQATGNQACFSKDEDSGQESIMGSTDTCNSVSWTDCVGGSTVASGTCSLDSSGGFSFPLTDSTPGLHTITITTTNQQTQQVAQQTLSELINNISVSNPTTAPGSAPLSETGRFSPLQGQSVSVTLTSQIADSFDVEIVNPFNGSTCISMANPMKASDFLNGSVSEQVINTWNVNLAGPGQTTISWNGTDSNSIPVPAGPYIIRVARTNADGLLAASFDTIVTVDGSGVRPAISSVSSSVIGTSVAILWQTAVPTQGAVSYSEGDIPVGRVPLTNSSTFHIVYLPITDPGVTYTYWVLAQDAAGSTSLSQAEQVTTGSGESFGDVWVTPVSNSAVNITWSSSDSTAGRVEYACVGSTLSRQTANDSTIGQQHTVPLTGLTANSEYVYRVESASDTSFANASVSQYFDFVTKTSPPSVAIVSPADNQRVSGIVNVSVAASDPIQRFPGNGITSVQLCVDGAIPTPSTHTSGSSQYLFSVDTSNLSSGVHQIVAYATDDFWNTATCVADILVGGLNVETVTSISKALDSQSPGGSTPSVAPPRGVVVRVPRLDRAHRVQEAGPARSTHTYRLVQGTTRKHHP